MSRAEVSFRGAQKYVSVGLPVQPSARLAPGRRAAGGAVAQSHFPSWPSRSRRRNELSFNCRPSSACVVNNSVRRMFYLANLPSLNAFVYQSLARLTARVAWQAGRAPRPVGADSGTLVLSGKVTGYFESVAGKVRNSTNRCETL